LNSLDNNFSGFSVTHFSIALAYKSPLPLFDPVVVLSVSPNILRAPFALSSLLLPNFVSPVFVSLASSSPNLISKLSNFTRIYSKKNTYGANRIIS